jgi:two-component system, LytTR family, response regulator AlgR
MQGESMRVLIVDDEPLAVDRLCLLCAAMPGVSIVGNAGDGETALQILADAAPDTVLLDIAMPGLSGLDVARVLETLARPPAVIFCTAFDQHAMAAFDVSAVDYVLKPVSAERLSRAMDRARARVGAAVRPRWLEELWVPYRSEMIRLAVNDIRWIEAERDYVRLHAERGSFLLHHTMSALEARLDPNHFLRLHRSAIVRAEAVVRMRRDEQGNWIAVLTDGTEQRVSRGGLAAARCLLDRA